jgi:import receptor subunit TOM70
VEILFVFYDILFCLVSVSVSSFDKSVDLDPENVNTRIKRASIFMEKGDIESTLREYLQAEEIDKNDADLYYHRGKHPRQITSRELYV